MSDPATDRMRTRGDVPAWQRVGLGVRGEYVRAALIDEVLAQTFAGSAAGSRRVRLLPARVVMQFVLALTLFTSKESAPQPDPASVINTPSDLAPSMVRSFVALLLQ